MKFFILSLFMVAAFAFPFAICGLLSWLDASRQPLPKVGDTWRSNFGTDGDPWAKPESEIIVTEVTDGWARCKFVNYPNGVGHSKSITDLRRFWKRVDQ